MSNRYFFNSLLSLDSVGINPLDLNPYTYFQTYNPLFLTPTTPNIGDSITEIYKYNDSLYIASGDTGCVGTWENLDGKNMIYIPGIDGGCWPPPCSGTCSTYYTTNQNISFMSMSGYEYTVYFVGKPLSGNSFSDGHIFSDIETSVLFGGRYVSMYVKDNKDIYFRSKRLGINSDVIDIPFEINISENDLETKNTRVFSLRTKDPLNTTSIAATSYINGVETTAITQTNVSNVTTESSIPFLIGAGATDGPSYEMYQGYFGELIIFNTYHDLTTHNSIIDFLKNRWGIN